MTDTSTIEIFNSFEPRLKLLWEEIEKDADLTPFQSYTWLLNWFETVGKPLHKITLCIICIYDEDKLEVILPMGIRKSGVIRKLEWLGGIHSDYMSPIVLNGAGSIYNNFEYHWKKVLTKLGPFDVLHLLKQLPKTAGLNNKFLEMYPPKNTVASYQAIFKDGWEDYKNTSINKKILADSKRQRRRLTEIGAIDFKMLSSEEEIKEITNKMFEFKQQRYKEMNVLNVLKNEEHKNFYKKMPTAIGSIGKIHCSALYLDDEIIALHWGVETQKVFYYLMPAHSGDTWSKFSPGKLLLEELMKVCANKNIMCFDFTAGDEPYKRIWTNSNFVLGESLKAFSVKGKLYIFLISIKEIFNKYPLLKKLYNKIKYRN